MLMTKIECRGLVLRKISLFYKMQRGRSPSFELFILDMYVYLFYLAIIGKKSCLRPRRIIQYFGIHVLYICMSKIQPINIAGKLLSHRVANIILCEGVGGGRRGAGGRRGEKHLEKKGGRERGNFCPRKEGRRETRGGGG